MPAEDPHYDVITERPWSQGRDTKGSNASFWFSSYFWRRNSKASSLSLNAKEEEQLPLLQRQQTQGCAACAEENLVAISCARPEPVARGPGSSRHASTAAAAAAAAKLAVYETLLSLGAPSCGHPSVGGRRCSCTDQQQKQQDSSSAPLLFPVAVPLGFQTRGRIEFESVTVAYRLVAQPTEVAVHLTPSGLRWLRRIFSLPIGVSMHCSTKGRV